MQLTQLSIKNFRIFEEKTIDFNPCINLLIGESATGKSTILDALRVGLGAWFLGFRDLPSHPIRNRDIRLELIENVEGSGLEQYPVEVFCSGLVGDQEINWSRKRISKTGRTDQLGANSLKSLAVVADAAIREGKPATLPLIAYYPADRTWAGGSDKFDEVPGPQCRLAGYQNCLEHGINKKHFSMMWKRRQLIEAQKETRLPLLGAVREAVLCALPEVTHLRFDYDRGELAATFEDGRLIPYSLLSNSYRSTLSIFADLATRTSLLNPHLGREAVRDTPGVVLIDEIDLHLHPSWQMRILDDFCRAFPKIQLIATTNDTSNLLKEPKLKLKEYQNIQAELGALSHMIASTPEEYVIELIGLKHRKESLEPVLAAFPTFTHELV